MNSCWTKTYERITTNSMHPTTTNNNRELLCTLCTVHYSVRIHCQVQKDSVGRGWNPLHFYLLFQKGLLNVGSLFFFYKEIVLFENQKGGFTLFLPYGLKKGDAKEVKQKRGYIEDGMKISNFCT